MFDFHQEVNSSSDGFVLCISLPQAIHSEFASKLQLEHCDFASDIVWREETLCATVFVMKLQLAQFLIKHKQMFNISEVIVVSSKDTNVSEISLLDGRHMDPLEYIALGSEEKDSVINEEIARDGNNDFA